MPRRQVDTDTIVARCKLQHVDCVVDNDEVLPGNINAIELALQALTFRRNADTVKSTEYLNEAIQSLNAELTEQTGEGSWGTVQMDPACSMVSNLL